MPDELLSVLTKFHREVVVLDIERIVGGVDSRVTALRKEMLSHFDAMYKRFDRLESEHEKRAFFELAEKLANSSNTAEQKRLKEELARMTFVE